MDLQALVDAAHAAASAAGQDQARDVGAQDGHAITPAMVAPSAGVAMLTDRPAVTARVLGPIGRIWPRHRARPRIGRGRRAARPPPIDETGRRRDGFLAIERALTVRVDGHEIVTLMTLGAGRKGWCSAICSIRV